MVSIWIVWMRMLDWPVHMPMRVWVARRSARIVFVLVMLVVAMSVGVSKRFVLVLMPMFLGQMQPYAETHQYGGANDLSGDRFAQRKDRDRSANEEAVEK